MTGPGPKDQLKCQALVSLLQVSKRTVAFLVSCFVVMFVCREENNPSRWQENHLFSSCNAKKPPKNLNIIYTVLGQTFKLQHWKKCYASSPINGSRNAEENEEHRKTRNQSKFGIFFQNRVSSIRYTDTQFLSLFRCRLNKYGGRSSPIWNCSYVV